MSDRPILIAYDGAADERDVGVVVMGSAGRTGIPRVLIGSVSGAVASHSKRPVLIAHA
jgi:nucleotide-binding universal stress UspA family protein